MPQPREVTSKREPNIEPTVQGLAPGLEDGSGTFPGRFGGVLTRILRTRGSEVADRQESAIRAPGNLALLTQLPAEDGRALCMLPGWRENAG